MIRTFAIALTSLRAAVRSRLAISLAAILLLTVVGLGLSIKGDGTLTGQTRILLYYTLGLSTFLLGTATLWTSCGGIAEEIKDKHIQLLVVKPVHRFQIWLGKWLGLVLLNTVLLALIGISVYTVLQIKIRRSNVQPADRLALNEDILTVRRSVLPRTESLKNEVLKRVGLLVKQHNISPRISRRGLCASVERRLRAEQSTVPPGGSKQWIFDVPVNGARNGQDPNATYSLRVRLYPANRSMTPLKGKWTVGWRENLTAFSHPMENRWENEYRFSVPSSALCPGEAAFVKFENGDRQQSSTVVLDPERNVELLIRESSFEMNLMRTLLILLGHLSLVAALGLTASTVFSFPVATFVTVSMMIVSLMGHYAAVTAGEPTDPHAKPEEPSLFAFVAERVMERLEVVIEPAVRLDPLDPLSDGVLVSWSFTGRAGMILMVLYPAVSFLIGAYLLKRRELALPE
jgi:hypothetical protein